MTEKLLHFTLGPVQSFVTRSRRTRDLWAGSFLLSWLTGQAISNVMDAGGRIAFPVVHNDATPPAATDPFLKAIRSRVYTRITHDSPFVGSIPNRFKAIVPAGFDANTCKVAIKREWNNLADAVYAMFVRSYVDAGNGNHTEAIWKNQIEHFWEIAWVTGDDPGNKTDGAWLDMRKNWRTCYPPDEVHGADHCTVMGDWPELSGYVRANAGSKQDAFWTGLREHVRWARKGNTSDDDPGVGVLSLRDDERLCAIAFIKRMFPKLGKDKLVDVIGWVPGEKPSRVGNWPSTAHMAAVHWIERAHDANSANCEQYVQTIQNVVGPKLKDDPGLYGETMTQIRCLEKARNGGDLSRKFANLEGDYFFLPDLENPRSTVFQEPRDPITGKESDTAAAARKQAIVALTALQHETALPPPSPFYAILQMDGDQFGVLLRELNPAEVAKSLGRFVVGMDEITRKHNGVTIYAGGEDVLALFPLEDAIDAAIELREAFRTAFVHASAATISASIVFAHYHLPLKAMLYEANRQLVDVAKDRNGRDSLAIAVWQSSGLTLEWVSTWCANGGVSPPKLLSELAREFAKDKLFSNRFLYKVRERIGVLVDERHRLPDGLDAKQLLLAEYMANRESKADVAQAEQHIERLYAVCQAHARPPSTVPTLRPEGALLIRFLAKNGLWP